MKIFIVFLAFSLVMSFALVYQSDMNEFMQAQRDLKALAEDCAEAGALCRNDDGKINPKKARQRADEVLKNTKLFDQSELRLSENPGVDGASYGVTVEYVPKRPFFSFLRSKVNVVKRSSVYEWVE